MRPMIKRVAERVRDCAGPGEEFFLGIGIAGDDGFRFAIGAHGPPFVVIALQPHLAEICKTPIVGHLGRWQVIVVIEDRLALGVLVVQPLRGIVAQQKVVVNKRHGTRFV